MNPWTREELEPLVDAGIGVLDRETPLWWRPDLIILPALNLREPESCILGQSYPAGEYTSGYFAAIADWCIDPAEYGFELHDDEDVTYDERYNAYELLTDIWREKIQQRRDATPTD